MGQNGVKWSNFRINDSADSKEWKNANLIYDNDSEIITFKI